MGDALHCVPALPVRADGLGEDRTANELTQMLRDWLVGMKSASSRRPVRSRPPVLQIPLTTHKKP
jgi:hypothetical protein